MTARCASGLLLWLTLSTASSCAGALEAEAKDLRPGLVARYSSLVDREATLERIDRKPAFYLGLSSPHPRIPPGSFEVVWTGVLRLSERGPLRFNAHVCGEVTMSVDGVRVLDGRGATETSRIGPKVPLKREPGLYRVEVHYRALERRPARLQIGWEGPSFRQELLPAWHLGHLAADQPRAVAQQEQVEKGRALVTRLGCARCHKAAFPSVEEPPPGPALSDVKTRLHRAWLLDWLEDPARVRPGAHMPALFAPNRQGFVERWIVTEHLLGSSSDVKRPAATAEGNHRMGRRSFVAIGCAACHFVPDIKRTEQPDLGQFPLMGLVDRLPAPALAAFLQNPHLRYPDGRMPKLPLTATAARDLAAYLLLESKPRPARTRAAVPTAAEIREMSRRLGVPAAGLGAALVRGKRCSACHPGLDTAAVADVPLTAADDRRGCLSGKTLPNFTLTAAERKALAAYRTVAAREKHPAPFARRQRLIEHLGCLRCHQRDSDRGSPLEMAGSKLGGAWLQNVPFQRTPPLTYPHQKYRHSSLLDAVRAGVSGLRGDRYSYRMPAFGADAETVVRALAEGDGELPDGHDAVERLPADRTLGPRVGPRLLGFQGYGCVSCHLWNGKALADPDPGARGPDLTRVVGRIRRDWFDRYLEGPARFHPRTPMPTIFSRGQPAPLRTVLDGDAAQQKDALWSYLALGKEAPSPKPPPPLAIPAPRPGEPPLIAQIPVRLPDDAVVEGLCLLYASHDLFVFDVGAGTLHSAYRGARILRDVQGRLRSFTIAGTPIGTGLRADPPFRLLGPGKPEVPAEYAFDGYDRLRDGVRLRWYARFRKATVTVAETLRLSARDGKRFLLRELRLSGIPAAHSVEVRARASAKLPVHVAASTGTARDTTTDGIFHVVLAPDAGGKVTAVLRYALPPAGTPAAIEVAVFRDTGKIEGARERPGYRALAYPRPKTASGEDRVMPGALAIDPKDGRVFVASMKTGELFVLRDPTGDGRRARFDNYAHSLFQEAFSMLAEPGALYVLHRRNLTRIVDRDGVADRFDRVAALPHGIANTYDYAYGLARDRKGAFIYSFAPYANRKLPGSGGALRLVPGHAVQEVAYGFRNPLGWCSGPDGAVFFTDNQGEWVATNKLCHLSAGRFYGFPNPAQRQHASKPRGRTAVWVPYAWAKSINGVAYDGSGGKFGPFAGQLFLAELMFGGGIVRANVEKINGTYQGACFPFWGPGLLGPLTLAFDPQGRLWVGSITEPGWMAQPDRGALFRIDYTGHVPFEMKSIHVLPHGFRIVFTSPVSPRSARDQASYRIEHYRYEYTGAYGSPELDRTRLPIERIALAADGRSVDVRTGPLVKDRVYLIQAPGVRSPQGEKLVHPAGAYTLNEIPAGKR